MSMEQEENDEEINEVVMSWKIIKVLNWNFSRDEHPIFFKFSEKS